LIKEFLIACLFLLSLSPTSYTSEDSLDVPTSDSLKATEKEDLGDTLSGISSYRFLHQDRFKEELLESFSLGDLITSEDVDNSTGESVGDVLKMRSWIDVMNMVTSGQPEVCSVGGNPRGTNIMVEERQFRGQDLHFPHRGVLDLNSVPLSIVSRIEFLPAGLANLWGDGTGLLGINIITKDFDGEEPYSRMTANKGPYGFSRTQAELGRSLTSRGSFYFTAEFGKSDGRLTNSDYDDMSLSGKTTFRLKRGMDLRCSAYQYKTDAGLPLFPDASYQDLRKEANNWGVVSSVLIQDTGDSFLSLDLNYDRQNQEVKSIGYDMESKKEEDHFALRATRTFLFKERHHLRIEGDIERKNMKALTTEKATYGSFLSVADLIEKSPKLKFLIFSKMGKEEGLEFKVSAGGGIFYEISENLRVFSSLGRFVGYPSLMDRFWPALSLALKDTLADYVEEGDPGIKPQKSLVIDLGVSFEKKNHRLGVYVLGSDIDDFLFWSNQDTILNYGYFKPVNTESKIWGTSVDLQSKFFNHFSSYLSYSFKWSEDSKRNTRLPYSPQHALFGFLQFEDEFLRREIGLKLRMETNILSERFMDEYEKDREPGVAILNGKITIRFLDFHFHYTVRNITNESYRLMGKYPMPERTYWWGFYWEFFD
jgi:outer membrane cobalamin receptor